jgi:hypothetical protein
MQRVTDVLILRVALVVLALLALGGCASGSPYYHGGTSYNLNNVGGLPVSGSVRVGVSPAGVRITPQIRMNSYTLRLN